MNISLHRLVRTTPEIRREIAMSTESVASLARRYHITEMTVRQWPVCAARKQADNGKALTDRLFESKDRLPTGRHDFDQLCKNPRYQASLDPTEKTSDQRHG